LSFSGSTIGRYSRRWLIAVPKVRVGWRVPVRVAAENHNLLMFEWDRL
jgi:hypothetical protein